MDTRGYNADAKDREDSFYTLTEHYILYLYGSLLYYTLPTARYILGHPFTMNKITDELYISDFSSACDIEKLHENQITSSSGNYYCLSFHDFLWKRTSYCCENTGYQC